MLKRIVSSRRFFWAPTTYVWLRNKKNNFQLHTLIWGPDKWYCFLSHQLKHMFRCLKEPHNICFGWKNKKIQLCSLICRPEKIYSDIVKKFQNWQDQSQITLAEWFNYFLASLHFCHLLITLANSLDPGQDLQNIGPDLNTFSIWHSESVPERLIWKNLFEKKSADDNKSMKLFPAYKETKGKTLP